MTADPQPRGERWLFPLRPRHWGCRPPPSPNAGSVPYSSPHRGPQERRRSSKLLVNLSEGTPRSFLQGYLSWIPPSPAGGHNLGKQPGPPPSLQPWDWPCCHHHLSLHLIKISDPTLQASVSTQPTEGPQPSAQDSAVGLGSIVTQSPWTHTLIWCPMKGQSLPLSSHTHAWALSLSKSHRGCRSSCQVLWLLMT